MKIDSRLRIQPSIICLPIFFQAKTFLVLEGYFHLCWKLDLHSKCHGCRCEVLGPIPCKCKLDLPLHVFSISTGERSWENGLNFP
ncbi:hypothetical protein JHK82_024338 [Glycine max]|uniref:Uncharacterized protein n=2 Tax=Glycine subgen. Soja TaxID=1462606 RepID=A0A0R0IBI2_SOYBN|nr:hypothetical protein JHK85_024921 [Glycine max]KAG5012169.1 hypothetical protein JHK86_024430 [Glycine max]KAG5133150.1 hypothetical protein JHK82_024338 [Glycine max]KAH1042017.1 hypothetical protein GYH30_024370 [Glycine max]RZB91110.1 hypothetical protein D0Y65_023489 [Glycine soja]